LKKLC